MTLVLLPPLLVLTDRTLCAPRPLVDVVRAAVDGGARAVILREKDLPRDERAAIADELRPILHDTGGLLLVASDPTIECDGVHLAAADPFPDPRPAIVGRSCHDLTELQAADTERCDYVTFSPVFPSISKPGYRPDDGADAALARLQELTDATTIPVFALGGIQHWTQVLPCLTRGAHGVAILGAAMQHIDSDETATLLRKAPDLARQLQEAQA